MSSWELVILQYHASLSLMWLSDLILWIDTNPSHPLDHSTVSPDLRPGSLSIYILWVQKERPRVESVCTHMLQSRGAKMGIQTVAPMPRLWMGHLAVRPRLTMHRNKSRKSVTLWKSQTVATHGLVSGIPWPGRTLPWFCHGHYVESTRLGQITGSESRDTARDRSDFVHAGSLPSTSPTADKKWGGH